MTHTLLTLGLAAFFVVGLALVPLGLPGLWVMVLAVIAYGALTGWATVGTGLIALVVGLALLGEILESWLGFRYAKRYGGSSRSGWGALAGGLVGAIVGLPIPVLGSVIGAFVGSFLGGALFEFTVGRDASTAARAGWGAVIGRTAAAALKVGLGIVIAVLGMFAAW